MKALFGSSLSARRSSLFIPILSFLIAVALTAGVALAQTEANWNNRSGGNWTTASDWDCPSSGMNCVPNNAGGDTYNVTINYLSGDSSVTVDNTSTPSSITVNSVTLNESNLYIGDGASLTVTGTFMTSDSVLSIGAGSTITASSLGNLSGGTLTAAYDYLIEGTFDYGGGSGNTITTIGGQTAVQMDSGSALMTPDGATNALSTLAVNNGYVLLDNGAGVGATLSSLSGYGELQLGNGYDATGSALSVAGNYDQGFTVLSGPGSTLTVGGAFSSGNDGDVGVDVGSTITANGFGNLSAGMLAEGSYVIAGTFDYGGGSGNTIATIGPQASVRMDSGSALMTPDGTTNAFKNLSTINGLLELDGGSVGTLAPVTIGKSGSLYMNGGTLTASSVSITPGGTLCGGCAEEFPLVSFGGGGGAPTIDGDVVSDGTVSLLSRGGHSILTINGNYTQNADGTLLVDIYGATDFMTLDVTGAAALDGTVEFDFMNDYIPAANIDFAFLEAGIVSGNFTSVQFLGDNCLTCRFDPSTLSVDTGNAPSPEPASVILFGTGLLGLCAIELRRKRSASA